MPLIDDIFDEPFVTEDGELMDMVRDNSAALSLEDDQPTYEEAFGTEAPGVGWIYCGELRWVRGLPRGKCSEE